MVSAVEDFRVSPMQYFFSTYSNGQSSGRFLCQSNEQICPVEHQEGSFPWKSLSPEWLPLEQSLEETNEICALRLFTYRIDANTTALLIRAAFGIFWLKSPLFGVNT